MEAVGADTVAQDYSRKGSAGAGGRGGGMSLRFLFTVRTGSVTLFYKFITKKRYINVYKYFL